MGIAVAAIAAVLSLQDPEAPVCKEGALTTIEINECALLDLIREESRMNAYLAKAQERAAETDRDSVEWGPQTRQVAYLAEAQATWARYAEITCEAVYDAYAGGTIRTVMALGCKIEMTRGPIAYGPIICRSWMIRHRFSPSLSTKPDLSTTEPATIGAERTL